MHEFRMTDLFFILRKTPPEPLLSVLTCTAIIGQHSRRELSSDHVQTIHITNFVQSYAAC